MKFKEGETYRLLKISGSSTSVGPTGHVCNGLATMTPHGGVYLFCEDGDLSPQHYYTSKVKAFEPIPHGYIFETRNSVYKITMVGGCSCHK